MSTLIIDLARFPLSERVGDHVNLHITGIVYRHEAPLAEVSGYDARGQLAYVPTAETLEVLIDLIEEAQ